MHPGLTRVSLPLLAMTACFIQGGSATGRWKLILNGDDIDTLVTVMAGRLLRVSRTSATGR